MSNAEIWRQLNEMAAACGKSMQSPQTGFVHYYPQAAEGEAHHPIPVYENFLFALALLRTKTAEGIAEAKGLIAKLLPFQTKEGNFPINLHEYPVCHDAYFAIQLLPCFYRILSAFQSVLGAELAKELHEAAAKSLCYALKTSEQFALPDTYLIKLGAAAAAFKDPAGEKLLQQAPKTADSLYWYQPAAIADTLSSLQLIYPSIANSPWSGFWEHVVKTWHQPTCTYIGPSLKEFQKNTEPQPSLYDLLLGSYAGAFSRRVKVRQPYHLQAVLAYPAQDEFPLPALPFSYAGVFQENRWIVVQHPQYAYSAMEKKERGNRAAEQGFHPLRMIWGSAEATHTFVMQGGNWQAFSFEPAPDGIDCVLDLDTPYTEEDREKQREVIFFTNLSAETSLSVDGQAATTFLPSQTIEIIQKGFGLKLNFLPQSSSAKFQGHLMRGNRPAQTAAKGPQRFAAFDWQIFLRTIRRDHPCRVKTTLRVVPGC